MQHKEKRVKQLSGPNKGKMGENCALDWVPATRKKLLHKAHDKENTKKGKGGYNDLISLHRKGLQAWRGQKTT